MTKHETLDLIRHYLKFRLVDKFRVTTEGYEIDGKLYEVGKDVKVIPTILAQDEQDEIILIETFNASEVNNIIKNSPYFDELKVTKFVHYKFY